MKRICYILVLLCSSINMAFAGNYERSVLEVRLSDNTPLVVTIDNRDYKKVGRSITVGNLPRGWHDLRVYEYKEYKDGGGRAKLLYSGQVRIKPGTVTRCMVDVRNGRLMTTTSDIDDPYIDYENNNNDYRNDRNDNYNDRNSRVLTTQDMNDLQARVEERMGDNDKVKLITSVLEQKTYTTNDVRTMANWLAFESSRLDLAKAAYNNVSDKSNYWKLEDVFTFSSTKDEFSKYIKSKKQ